MRACTRKAYRADSRSIRILCQSREIQRDPHEPHPLILCVKTLWGSLCNPNKVLSRSCTGSTDVMKSLKSKSHTCGTVSFTEPEITQSHQYQLVRRKLMNLQYIQIQHSVNTLIHWGYGHHGVCPL